MSRSLAEKIADLEKRVSALEQEKGTKAHHSENNVTWDIKDRAVKATDAFAAGIYVKALAAGLKHIKLVRARDDYYSYDLSWRRQYLRAPTTDHLCKSIVMCNTRWKPTSGEPPNNVLNAQYYCVIVQYATKLSANDLTRIVKQLQVDAGRTPMSTKALHYRLAEDCLGVTGYEPNGVTPIGLKMPIVIDKAITKLEPAVLWCGGGEVSLKLELDIPEFMAAFKPIVGDVTPDTL